ncbi:MAG: type II toxin-antitoxin system RelE/ParE family toxin [Saprospiraceae bacterium]|nr:type II toxin-antitoxin system RelE/ParE family toxin [Saprospiraceae bacterium]
MGKPKIIWSHKAQIKLFEILEYYTQRNKSKVYSIKLYNKFTKELSLLHFQPEIGIKTEIEPVRGLIVDEYILFYEITTSQIIVHTIWDCRQNPNDLIIK